MKFPTVTTRRMLVLAIGLGTLAVAAWVVLARQQATAHRELLVAAVPTRPDLQAFPAELADRIGTLETAARAGDTQSVAALGQLCLIYHANGFLGEARNGYQALLDLDPDNPRWPYLLGIILAGYGQGDEAVDLFRQTLRLAPGYTPARLRLGDTLLKSGRIDEAADAYASVLPGQPLDIHALVGLARARIAADRWAEAREQLRRAASTGTDIETVWNLLATAAEKLGDKEEAAMARTASLGGRRWQEPRDPWVDALTSDCYDTYQLCVAAGIADAAADPETAQRLLERALAFAPDDAHAHRQLGILLHQENRLTAAREHLQRAVELAPDDSENWIYLYVLLNRLGDRSATRVLADGLARCPDSAALHLELGRRLRNAGQLEKALAEFEASQRLRPSEPVAFVEAAMVLFQLQRDADGAEALHGALRAEPEQPVALSALARYAILSGDEAGAIDLLRRTRAQQRVPREDVESLTRAFRDRFGHAP